MIRPIVVAIVLLCLPVMSAAAGNGQIDVTNNCWFGDTIVVGIPMALQFRMANDVQMGGFQVPITLSSPDGATWTWNSQLDGWGTHKYVTHNPGSRIDPPAEHFDLTVGLLVNEVSLPNKILVGGGVMFGPGLAPGSLEEIFAVHITVTGPPEWQIHQLCVDLTQTVGPATFGFIDLAGHALTTTFLDPNGDGKWCFPVVNFPCKSSPAESKMVMAEPPIIDCGDPWQDVPSGSVYERTLTGEDPSLCGFSMVYSISHISDTLYRAKTPTNAPSIDAVSGLFRWLPTEADTGLWMFTAALTTIGDPVECTFTIDPYLCGDANGDEQINIGDAVYIVSYIFRGGAAPAPLEAGDVNRDSQINVGDAVYLVGYIFRSGPAPCGG